MDERVRFVARLLEGEKVAVLCPEFGIPIWPPTGVPKLRERLKQKWLDMACPAISTVHAAEEGLSELARRGHVANSWAGWRSSPRMPR